MRRRQLLHTCLLALCLAMPLAACGGQSSSASVASGSDQATATSSSQGSGNGNTTKTAVTKETIEGDWMIIKSYADGVAVYGDLSSADTQSTASFGKDGSFRLDIGNQNLSGTWKLDGDKVVANLMSDDPSMAGTMTFAVLENGNLSFEDMEQDWAILLTRSYENGEGWPLDPTKAKPIKEASQLVGSWKTSGFVSSLFYMEGNLESVDVPTLSITLKEDGTGKMTHTALGEEEDITWEIGTNGAKVTYSKGSFTLLDGGDYLIADMTGASDNESSYVLVKA